LKPGKPPLPLEPLSSVLDSDTDTCRLSAETMPLVTVFCRLSGEPIATVWSPTCTSSEFAKASGVQPEPPSAWTTAMSSAAMYPTTFAL
jgi:hypothetical protein